jgi:hypothetical protein
MTGPRNGTGNAALAVAIAGLFLCWSVVGGIVCGVVAVILGFLGRGRAARREANNGGIATAGIALGVVAVVASVAFAVIWTFAWRDAGGTDYLDCAVRAGKDQKAVESCTDNWLNDIRTKFSITPPRVTQGST